MTSEAVRDQPSASGSVATSSSPPSAEAVRRKKKTLVDQLLVVENARERLDLALERLSGGSPMLQHERDCLAATAQTLMLLMEHEADVVAMVKRKREAAAGRSRRSSQGNTPGG